jgi:hypothetical protein
LFKPPINTDDAIFASHSLTVVDDSAGNTPFISITNSRTVRLSSSLHDLHLLLDDHFCNFDKETASQRLAHIRQILLTMESQWNTVDRWGSGFMVDWNAVKGKAVEDIMQWFDGMTERIGHGRRVQGCLGRVMEGEMPVDIEEWRDLWVQAHQLTSTFNVGFLSLQHRLDLAVAQQLK